MVRPTLALVTSEENPLLFEEEQQLPQLFAARGVEAKPALWSDPHVDWSAFDQIVIRSTWDYYTRADEFRAWLHQLESRKLRVHNPPALIRWNMDKLYLAELKAQGVSIIPTHFIHRQQSTTLADVLDMHGWQDAILKPSISAGSHRTHRLNQASAAMFESELQDILQSSAALVQPFCPEIQTQGEWSILFFGGQYSHAVLKKPAANDYRSQPVYGAHCREEQPSDATMAAATKALLALPHPPSYVRIDGVERQGQFQLMEVEAIEPYLFSRHSQGALVRYRDALLPSW